MIGDITNLLVVLVQVFTHFPERFRQITSIAHSIRSDDYFSGSGGGGEPYQCQLTAMDSKIPYRPPRVTPKPAVQGPQTAIVVGKSGEEIWTDEHGRVKVQFHWDRYGKKDENSSCWVRVAQICEVNP